MPSGNSRTLTKTTKITEIENSMNGFKKLDIAEEKIGKLVQIRKVFRMEREKKE